jgi:hypothetical protein
MKSMKKFLVLALALPVAAIAQQSPAPAPTAKAAAPAPAKTDAPKPEATKTSKKSHNEELQELFDGEADSGPKAVRLRFRLRAGARTVRRAGKPARRFVLSGRLPAMVRVC